MAVNQLDTGTSQTGIVSLAKILQHFGVKTNEKELLQECKDTDRTLSWNRLKEIAKKHRLRSETLHPTPDELREIAVPAIVKMKNGGFVVLVVNNDEAVFLIDPRLDKPIALSQHQFVEVWSGPARHCSGAPAR